jgi:hypothetical protein
MGPSKSRYDNSDRCLGDRNPLGHSDHPRHEYQQRADRVVDAGLYACLLGQGLLG